ncbi:MAG TPA: hypothetical protein VHQ65_06735 [Thermoanaerobaculia bacterium]|nr:hypothetical protein [Thermoanaerobaculia bacterium]
MDPLHARFRAVSELRDLMIAMRREALRREHPDESAEQIEQRLTDWVVTPVPPVRNRRSLPHTPCDVSPKITSC